MGILEDAIREHLDLKRKHGAPEPELERQEVEALGPARRGSPSQQPADEAVPADGAPNGDPEAPLAEAEALDDDGVGVGDTGAALPVDEHVAFEQAPVDDALPVETGAPAPADFGHAPVPPDDEPVADFDHGDAAQEPAADFGDTGVAPPADLRHPSEPEEPAADFPEAPAQHEPPADVEEAPVHEPSADLGQAPERDEPDFDGPADAPVDDRPSAVDQPTELFDVEETFGKGDTPARGFPAQDDASEDDAPDDAAPGDQAPEDEDEPSDEESADLLEDTPDFLQDAPEHDRLWFEQKPPRDFDFD